IVLDPELSVVSGEPIIDFIRVLFPGVPIILHTLRSDIDRYVGDSTVVACVEKNGNSVVTIHQIILANFQQKHDGQMVNILSSFNLTGKID
ncbi:MAG: hypothetical protein HQ517_09120, partial [SAR324 cluster bacterium]|nr:hypothetical protein [SAR324 cluster bacterium]